MAEKKSPNKGAPFVAAVVKDPQAPPDALLVAGFVGPSSEEAHCRLYLDAQLSDYVEIPEDAILFTQDLPKDSSPLGGTYLWIARDAEVIHGKADGKRYAGSFLEGRLAQVFPTLPIVCTCLPQDASTDADGVQDPNPKGDSSMTYTIPPFCPPAAGSADIPTLPVTKCTTIPIVCCDVAGAAGTHAASAAHANWPTVIPPTCLPPVCGAAAAPAQIPTLPVTKCITIPIVCCFIPEGGGVSAQAPTEFPTAIAPTCNPFVCGASAAAPAHIPTLPVTKCATIPIVCCDVAGAVGSHAGSAATFFPPTCLPPVCGAVGAQAQIPTLPVTKCMTIPIVCCDVAGAAGSHAGSAATFFPPTCLPPVCGAAGASAQIPTLPVTKCTTIPIVCC